MSIQVQSADGVIHEFPDGTRDAVIDGAMKAYVSGSASKAPKGEVTPPAKPRLGAMDTVNGLTDNLLRGTGVGDELAAGWRTAVNTVGNALKTGKSPTMSGIASTFKDSMAKQRLDEDQAAEAHPYLAGAAKGAGIGATILVPGGAATKAVVSSSRTINAARGAVAAGLGAATYAAADRGTGQERLQAAADAAHNPLVLGLGAAGGALGPTATRAKPAVAPPQTDANVLKDIGVQTTIPQKMGAAAKGVEDLGMRFPIIGQAISGARDRQVGQLNRGIALKALEPIGETLPAHIKPGFEMVEHVDSKLGDVYDRAAAMVPKASVDAPFMADLAHIQERAGDLADTEAKQFAGILDNRLSRLSADDASGATVKAIHSELGKLQAEAAKKGQDTLSGMIGDTRRALMGIIARANPEAGKLVESADKGWKIYSIMNDAAAAASNRGGVFLPGQLNTQVRAAGRRIGSNTTGKGKAPLQDIATAASRTLPDSFGNPGTANAGLLGAGGVGLVTAPVQTTAAAAGLAVAATPYLLAARKVMTELPSDASAAELQGAASTLAGLAQKDPTVSRLQAQIAARLARTGAVATASEANNPRNVLRASR